LQNKAYNNSDSINFQWHDFSFAIFNFHFFVTGFSFSTMLVSFAHICNNDVILLADSTWFHNHIFVQALRQAIDFNQLHCVM
jgi:hypothetical protein